LRCLPFGFSYRKESLVTVERRVGAAKAGVAGGVNALGGVVFDELGGGVVRVDLDFCVKDALEWDNCEGWGSFTVHGWYDFAGWVIEQ
jgi:hypothetical protein